MYNILIIYIYLFNYRMEATFEAKEINKVESLKPDFLKLFKKIEQLIEQEKRSAEESIILTKSVETLMLSFPEELINFDRGSLSDEEFLEIHNFVKTHGYA